MAKTIPPYLRSLDGGKTPSKADTSESPRKEGTRTTDARVAELEASFSATLRSLESRLDKALRDASGEVRETNLNIEIQRALDRIEARLRKELGAREKGTQNSDLAEDINRLLSVLDPAHQRDLATRTLKALRLKISGGDVDAYGKDAVLSQRAWPILDWFFTRHFRTVVQGLENVPKSGRVIFVGNHGGILPFDALMLAHAVVKHHPQHREVRPLIEDEVYHVPFLGVWLNRLGLVRASQENAERMLNEERAISVFPEGNKGINKAFGDRYELARFGRGGVARLALRTGATVIPVAILGSEETHPLLARVEWIGKLIGAPFFPITPTLPWLGLLGLIPLPVKWHLRFGSPVETGAPKGGDEELASDRLKITKLNEDIRARVQSLLDETRVERGTPFKL
jgi:1-acyl-sn-glycerol-3-phosphate acyltransferase